MHTDPKQGLGRSPNRCLGGQSPPTAKPSNKRIKSIVGLRSRCNYCARFMCMLFPKLMHTHQYLYLMSMPVIRTWISECLEKIVKLDGESICTECLYVALSKDRGSSILPKTLSFCPVTPLIKRNSGSFNLYLEKFVLLKNSKLAQVM